MNKFTAILTEKLLQQLLKGNRKKCVDLSREYLATNPSIKDLYEQVFKIALYKVGKLWENNKITVASEHLATAITEGILNELYEELEVTENNNNKVVLTCVESELHQVGIKMVADVFEMHGWDTYFLGTGIPISELVQYVKKEKPNAVAISLSIFFNYKKLIQTINVLKAEFSDLKIIAGGQAFTNIKQSNFSKIEGVKYISDLYDLEDYLKTI